jgi:RNA 2',3'-cyclic 3'-phosphodiesterase
VDADARLRLFCALRLPDDAIVRLGDWQRVELRGGRLVPPGNLHVTLAFLGSRPAGELTAIAAALRAAALDTGLVRLRVRGYRETRSVGMLTLEDEGGRATALAGRLHAGLEALGAYRPESRPWLPHVTVLRFQERPRLEPALPDLGEVAPSDAAVFISRLRPSGAEYESVETVALGG